MAIDQARIDELFEWMLDGARPSANAHEIISGICERLTAAGVPAARFALFIYTLHPNLLGRRFRWFPGEGVDQVDADLQAFDGDEYKANPLPTVLRTKEVLRRRLIDPQCPDDYQILAEFRADGITDYLVQPLIFTTGETHVATWASKDPDGFSEEAIAALERIRLPLARLTETYMLRLNASSLLSAYTGRDSGSRILAGRVHRGELEDLEACVVFADLVGFTEFSNAAPAQVVIERLNLFYDALVPPITKAGGEILKFMGDGLLAIFPVDRAGGAVKASSAALTALEAASGGKDTPLFDDKRPPFRAAVHIGPLQYGNIGAADRLDFTAIGPTVNLASRLLDAAKLVNGQTVVSKGVAELGGLDMGSAGVFDLKGFARPQKIIPVRFMPTL